MKKTRLLYITLMMLCMHTAVAAQAKIEIKKGVLKINGTTIQFPYTYSAITQAKVLDTPNRSDLGGSNDIFTYDTKGIMLYQTPQTNQISAMNIYYGYDENNDYDFIPKGMYTGSFSIEGMLINGTTSLAMVKKKLPQYAFGKSVIGAYRGEYKNVYIYLQYDISEKNILWISIGKTQ